MKSIAFFVAFVFCASAFAGKSEVTVRSISFDGTTLAYEYSTGGGCQEHTTEVEVDIVDDAKSGPTATVKIFDVTAQPDFCEAILYKNGSVNLVEAIKTKAQEKGFQGNYFDVVLPKATAVTF